MLEANIYGINRSLIPRLSNLEKAWKVDTSLPILDNEILIEVSVLNLNKASFEQIYETARGNRQTMAELILNIVRERGKLHNPVTGTGGMFEGLVMEMGASYKKSSKLKVGDRVISLVSLIATPIIIDEIKYIDFEYGQVFVKGKAILFKNSPIIKSPDKLPLKITLAALDIAGTPATVNRLVKKDQKVLVIGADNRGGFLSAIAARKKLENTGRLDGFVLGNSLNKSTYKDIFTHLSKLDLLDVRNLFKNPNFESNYYDVIIDSTSLSSMSLVDSLLVKNKGKIFLPEPGTKAFDISYNTESMGKEVEIISYRGYLENHTDFTLELLKENEAYLDLFESFSLVNLTERETEDEPHEMICLPDDKGVLKNFIMKSPLIRKTVQSAIKVSKFDCTVLITGESGTGKEMIAKIIYSHSKRVNSPYVRLNCAAIPSNLLESELFGYEKGAFTGAQAGGKTGLWEMAKGGIILLDEIGELPLMLQAKLLRVLQENEFYRVGGTSPIESDVRVLAITNKNLIKMVEKGRFREDLYYRLNVFPIYVPPLRYRKEDIRDLIGVFVNAYNKKFSLEKRVDPEVIKRMEEYNWKGNIRELENFVQRLLIESNKNVIGLEVLDRCINGGVIASKEDFVKDKIRPDQDYKSYMEEAEKSLLLSLRKEGLTTRQMASRLNISQASVSRKINKFEIE